jgi:hypothetical protein
MWVNELPMVMDLSCEIGVILARRLEYDLQYL